jgi:hypothetical protein
MLSSDSLETGAGSSKFISLRQAVTIFAYPAPDAMLID